MFNKKSQAGTDTAIVLFILAFQAVLIVGLGFINIPYESNNYSVPLTDFSFTNIVTSISYLGWFNSILFTPLIGIVLYIVARLIRGGG